MPESSAMSDHLNSSSGSTHLPQQYQDRAVSSSAANTTSVMNPFKTDNPAVPQAQTMEGSENPPVSEPDVSSTQIQPQKTNEETENSELANLMKEKTPMCLVNELARYNKIQHQYRLTSEQGPAHKKLFTVTLKLGEEEYSAEGASIKKAQHLAASDALKSTAYKHPPPKATRNNRLGKNNITPTVELNALAMKRGEPTVYTFIDLPFPYPTYAYTRGIYTQVRPPYTPVAIDYSRRNMTFKNLAHSYRYDSQRCREGYYPSKPPSLYKVIVKVGEREFNGEGPTAQAARHDAAAKALEELRNLPLEPAMVQANLANAEHGLGNIEADSSSELKSPISLVHELALKRNLPVLFDVISEKGPPHMRTFVTRCCVGDSFETQGEGNGKKISKKRAAEKMLEQLKLLLPPTTTVTATNRSGSIRMLRKPNPTKKKSRNLIKVTNSNKENNSENSETVEEINPISRLMQIQQAKKEKEPVYTMMEERGHTRKREFLMEVKVGEHSFVGTGPNKKVAKRNAAEGLLQKLGYSNVQPGKARLTSAEISRKAFVDSDNTIKQPVGGSGGRQLVPGLLLMTDNHVATANNNGYQPSRAPPTPKVNVQATAAMAKEYLNGSVDGVSLSGGGGDGKNAPAVRPKDQLIYLAQLLGFRVQFSDFPKGNHSEYLSLVSLSTDPPQLCHGAGLTTELSHDQAALTALRVLSEMGLDSVTPIKKEQTPLTQNTIMPNNDGMYAGKGNPVIKTNFVNGGASK